MLDLILIMGPVKEPVQFKVPHPSCLMLKHYLFFFLLFSNFILIFTNPLMLLQIYLVYSKLKVLVRPFELKPSKHYHQLGK